VSHRWFIAFNSEIYNHAELRAELETLGCNFATRSDTEVLINWWTGITIFPAGHVQRRGRLHGIHWTNRRLTGSTPTSLAKRPPRQ
jgi:Glutamine amidotransferase domain